MAPIGLPDKRAMGSNKADRQVNMPSGTAEMLKHALWYREHLGWSIIPVRRNKKPLRGLRWKKHQSEPPSVEQVQKWFTDNPEANIAVILGSVSRNLACRDFDKPEAWREFLGHYPEVASSLPLAATARGMHVYFIGITATHEYGDGELRGEGGYCVLPPSIHETGVLYTWERPPDGQIPTLDPAVLARRFLCASNLEGTEGAEGAKGTEGSKGTEGTESGCVKELSPKIPTELSQAIKMTLPAGPGERHDSLFKFCRVLKAMPQYANAEAVDLWPEFSSWWKRAEPFVSGTHDRTFSWDEFCEAWAAVEYPWGQSVMVDVLKEAQHRSAPKIVTQFEDKQLTQLARLCGTLQDHSGSGPFYLSVRKACELAGISSPKAAWRKLNVLKRHGVLEVVQRGTSGTSGKATRWRFRGDQGK